MRDVLTDPAILIRLLFKPYILLELKFLQNMPYCGFTEPNLLWTSINEYRRYFNNIGTNQINICSLILLVEDFQQFQNHYGAKPSSF